MRKLIKIFILCSVITLNLSCEKLFVEQPGNNPESIFENLWQTFHELYAPFDERNVNWNTEYTNYRPLVNQNTSDEELFTILSQMLAKLDDGHVSLTAPGREIFFANKIRREKIDDALFNKTNIKENYLEPGYEVGAEFDIEESYISGKIKGKNIGYIFFDNVGENFFRLNDFLEKYESADGIIIDLRHNQGGDFTYSFSEIGRLTNERRYVFRSKTKNGTGEGDYTPWKEWYIEPSGDYLNKTVIVLTDRYTISAGERAVMAFRSIPNVTIIGDTTNGAHGTMIGRELANGWFYSLVPQKVELFDGYSYEGIGLAPDIYIKNNYTDVLNGLDNTLQRAIDELSMR